MISQNQSSCPCCTDNHKAFDYWIGNWTVYNTEGDMIGTNKILKMHDGCVIQENWEAANKTNTGTSYNYFDPKDNTWNQLWVSNTGNILKLKGNINEDGNMELRSELTKGKKKMYYNRIVWVKNENGSVTQVWDILDENGNELSKAFEGIYKKN